MELRIGTWNVLTILQAGKWDIHVTAVKEIRRNGNGSTDKKDYTLLYSGQKIIGEKNVTGLVGLKNGRSSIMGF
jgi:hypothetical protein